MTAFRSIRLGRWLRLLPACLLLAGCAGPKRNLASALPEPTLRSRPLPRVRTTRRVASFPPSRPAGQPAPQVTPPARTTLAHLLPPAVALKQHGRKWQYIVIHHSATASGSARDFDGFHRRVNGWDELGYHFVIGNGQGSPDGHIEVGSRWHKQKHGAHCKTADNRFNDYGIGICLVGNFQDVGRPTPAQMAALEVLVRHLMDEFTISSSNILGHGDVTHRTQCPGRNLSVDQLRRRLSGVAFTWPH